MGERRQRVLGVAAAADIAGSATENSQFRVGDDIFILLDEVLNGTTRAVHVYDDFSGRFTDQDLAQLAAVARYNTSVLAINLCGVDVGDGAVSLLCDALVRARVRTIDLSNTVIAEEAGAALVALAHCNAHLRTVIVDETLVPEDMMDEIDMACQYNETVLDLPPPAPIDPARERFCARHCFGACPDGAFCPLSHRSIDSAGGCAADDRPLELPAPPDAGASWNAEGREAFRAPRLAGRLRRAAAGGIGAVSESESSDDDGQRRRRRREQRRGHRSSWAPPVAAAVAGGAVIAAVAAVAAALMTRGRRGGRAA